MGAFTYFISDLHLSAERQDITDCLMTFLREEAPKADALYVLGDLFEVWIGDDDVNPFTQLIAQAFKQLSLTTPIYFIHGNRDFVLKEQYAASAGMTLLPEQTVINLYNTPTLLLHGDELCTHDVEYMRFRKKSRSWWWQKLMLSLPLSWRKRIAHKGRNVSAQNKQQLNMDIMDVTPTAVVELFQKYQVKRMIHGHTHRPDIHIHPVKINEPTSDKKTDATRIVLGDWYTQGSVLKVDAHKFDLQQRTFKKR